MKNLLWFAVLCGTLVLTDMGVASPKKSIAIHSGNLKELLLESPAQDAPVCTLYPEQQGECDGLAKDSMQGIVDSLAGGEKPIAVGLIRLSEGFTLVMVSEIAISADAMSKEFLDSMVRGANASGTNWVEAPHLLRFRGYQAMKAIAKVNETRRVSLTLFGEKSSHSIQVVESSTTGLGADHILNSIQYTPGDLGRFGVSWYERMGKLFGYGILIVANISIVIWSVFRKKKTARVE